jgi:hypothetical protein
VPCNGLKRPDGESYLLFQRLAEPSLRAIKKIKEFLAEITKRR